MDRLDWNLLASFVAVAEEQHVTRAAERLNTQQPVLSTRMRTLERQVGAQLFRRKARGIELTESGRVLLAHARALFEQHTRTLEAVQRAGRGELGRLCIGTLPTGAIHPLMPSSVRLFRERYPDASVMLEECLRDELLERLRNEQVDVVFLRSRPRDDTGLVVEVLLTEEMVIALPNGHTLGKGHAKTGVRMRDLRDESFVVFARQQGPAFYDSTVAACQRAGFSPHIRQEAPRVTTALSLVAAGLGVCLVPASVQRIALHGVVFQPLEREAGLSAMLALGWRRSDASQALRNYMEIVRKLAHV